MHYNEVTDLQKCYSVYCNTHKGIVKIAYRDNHEFNVNDAKDALHAIEKATNGKAFPVLKIPGKYSSIDHEARKFISSVKEMKYFSAEAFVINFLPHRIIGNFYMKCNKPIKPTAFFETEEQTVEWLNQLFRHCCRITSVYFG